MDSFRDGFHAGYARATDDARKRIADTLHDVARDAAADFRSGNSRAAYQAELEDRVQRGTPVGGSFAQGGRVSGPVGSEGRYRIEAADGSVSISTTPPLSGRLANVRRVMAGARRPAGVGASRTVAEPGESLPQLHVVYSYDAAHGHRIWGADQQQGMSTDDALRAAERLKAIPGTRTMVLAITPESEIS